MERPTPTRAQDPLTCPHCTGLATELADLNALPLIVSTTCDACDHPGVIARDAGGYFAFETVAGRCNRGDCKACQSALLDALKAASTPEFADLLELPRAADLIAQAEAIAVALKEPARVSLRRIVDDFAGAAAFAAQYLSEKELDS